MLKYKCLILDHDDTVVKTTSEIHYPSFKHTIEELRPGIHVTEREFRLNCFNPGFFDYLEKIIGFNENEMQYQLEYWLKYIQNKIPAVYEGIAEIIKEQTAQGGIFCVVSHSYSEIIKRDYAAGIGVQPRAIYGGELPAEQRKPETYPIEQILKRFSLSKREVVMIDDSKPGLDMANKAGIDFICAGWSHCVKEISAFMRLNCEKYAATTEELRKFIFE